MQKPQIAANPTAIFQYPPRLKSYSPTDDAHFVLSKKAVVLGKEPELFLDEIVICVRIVIKIDTGHLKRSQFQ